MKKKFRCMVCGYVYEGENPPEVCPQCRAKSDKFVEVKSEGLEWACEHRLGDGVVEDAEIMEFLRTLGSRGFTVVMITHDMHLMLEYAARCIVFSDKKVIADDSSAGVLTSPDVIARASLKETSLYTLAKMCGIRDERAFVQSFIDYERKNERGASASAETASTGTEPGNTEQEGAQS